ncbi:branched-chain amino acid transport system II carrier protein [Escherichia coli]
MPLSLFWFRSIRQAAGYRGNFLAPLKIIALVILSVAAIVWRWVRPDGDEAYQTHSSPKGFVNGYLPWIRWRNGVWYRYC